MRRSRRSPEPDLATGDEFAAVAPVLLPTLLQVMDYVWRRHVQAEARTRIAREHGAEDPGQRAVGFADLVGFTALSQQCRRARARRGGRSLRGDRLRHGGGARWSGREDDRRRGHVLRARRARLPPRSRSAWPRPTETTTSCPMFGSGLAAGTVLQREADLFGPVVNRASRIVNIAFPGTVVCSNEIADALGEDPSFEARPIGNRNLKGIGKVPLVVLRRAGAPETKRVRRQEAEARRAGRREVEVEQLSERQRRGATASEATRSIGGHEPVPASHAAGGRRRRSCSGSASVPASPGPSRPGHLASHVWRPPARHPRRCTAAGRQRRCRPPRPPSWWRMRSGRSVRCSPLPISRSSPSR